ncbi:sigma factor-like helix-turn-helix DNA-binding protein [Gemmatimonas sp.]|uniref:sigma factor-like helix-turn-helix DNA-binding protein n=1 Tax=Gemmatimonas sp. TaxID=1962908 RepID=UPI003562CF2B
MGHVAARRSGLDAYVCSIDVGPAIRDAIGQLAAPCRVAVMLVDVEGMTYGEAAQVAKVPMGRIRSRLFRAWRFRQGQPFAYARGLGFTSAADPKSTRRESASITPIRPEP